MDVTCTTLDVASAAVDVTSIETVLVARRAQCCNGYRKCTQVLQSTLQVQCCTGRHHACSAGIDVTSTAMDVATYIMHVVLKLSYAGRFCELRD